MRTGIRPQRPAQIPAPAREHGAAAFALTAVVVAAAAWLLAACSATVSSGSHPSPPPLVSQTGGTGHDPVSLRIIGSRSHRTVFTARDVHGAAGIPVPALDSGSYTAIWVLHDANGDTSRYAITGNTSPCTNTRVNFCLANRAVAFALLTVPPTCSATSRHTRPLLPSSSPKRTAITCRCKGVNCCSTTWRSCLHRSAEVATTSTASNRLVTSS